MSIVSQSARRSVVPLVVGVLLIVVCTVVGFQLLTHRNDCENAGGVEVAQKGRGGGVVCLDRDAVIEP